jgi:hypothetical protein
MTVEQNQLWKQGDLFIRVVRVERLRVEYKTMKDPTVKEGLCEQSTKKAFCRLIKGATLVTAPLPLGDDEMT